MWIKASHIIPIEGADLHPGVIHIKNDRIAAIGDPSLLQQKSDNDEIIDLDGHVLLPGFVNAHCHLELTSLGPLEKSGGFVDWIKDLVRRKTQLKEDEIRQGIQDGAQKLLMSGVTAIGDHVSFNTPWEEILNTPLRGRIFAEVLGVIPEVCTDIYSHFKKVKAEFTSPRFTFHISPHSVHAVHPAILKEVLQNEPAPLSCHLAESESENEYFKNQSGPMHDLIHNRGVLQVPHGGKSGLDVLQRLGSPLEKLMVVHGNYLSAKDEELIQKHHLSIVHCPGSHNYFGHQNFPINKYLNHGFTVALGTDSLASNESLNFLRELHLLRDKDPSLKPEDLLKMATLHGAKALRIEDQVGSLKPGKKADVIGFKITPNQLPIEAAFHTDRADFVMIDGKKII